MTPEINYELLRKLAEMPHPLLNLQTRLDRIAVLHRQRVWPDGQHGYTCIECGCGWPCLTQKIAVAADGDGSEIEE